MSSNYSNVELLLYLGRIKSKDNTWNPCIKDMQDHDINALWVASVMYLLYDRYLSCIDDANQNEFATEVLDYFSLMIEEGAAYVNKNINNNYE